MCSVIVSHLFIFIYLSFALERAASLPELTPAQRNKLRHLSIISLASNLKVHIHYFLFAVLHRSSDELRFGIDFF